MAISSNRKTAAIEKLHYLLVILLIKKNKMKCIIALFFRFKTQLKVKVSVNSAFKSNVGLIGKLSTENGSLKAERSLIPHLSTAL